MKNKLLVLAALSLVAGAAIAQSNVTIYGTIDTGIRTQSNVATVSNCGAGSSPCVISGSLSGSKTDMLSGGIAPSHWGITGTEDLGGGLKATFNLQSHMGVDTGNSILDSKLFARSANVGLSGGFGTITLGRVYDPAFLAFGTTDPAGFRESFSGVNAWAFANYAAKKATYSTDVFGSYGVFKSNAVTYAYSANGFGFSGMYAMGEKAGNSNADEVVSLALTYKGPILFSATYGSAKDSTGNRTGDVYTTGVGYVIGNATVKANYMNGKAADNSSESKTWSIGGDYKLTGNSLIRAAYFRSEDAKIANTQTNNYVVGYEYGLSKRTTLYAQGAYAKLGTGHSTSSTEFVITDHASAVGASSVAGKSSTVFNTGIKHSF